MKLVFIMLVFALLPAAALAQSVDKVMLVSDITSADMLIAKAAAEKTGIPVLVLENGTLTDDTLAELSGMSIRTIILVGGPAVIDQQAEEKLSSYTVLRLWGHERTGTALKVASYFWQEGAKCLMITDDTKDSEVDTELHTQASEAAAIEGCPLIPVPAGSIPAEVLGLARELSATEAHFVGRLASQEFRRNFANLNISETIGNNDQIDDELARKILNSTNRTKLRLLIVAAPHWKDVLGTAGNAGRHTIVRIVSSTESVPRLINIINENNITNIFVTGNPGLSGEIAGMLESEGIIPAKVSGERAADVARKLLKENLERWKERQREVAGQTVSRNKLKQHLYNNTDRLELRLGYLETELTSLNISGATNEGMSALKTKIDNAQSQLSSIRNYIDNGNYDTARARIAKIEDDVNSFRWLHRTDLKLNITELIDDEETTVEETEQSVDTGSLERRVDAMKDRCNTTILQMLLDKAKKLREAAAASKEEGDRLQMSEAVIELRDLARQMGHLSDACESSRRIDLNLQRVADKRLAAADIIATRTAARSLTASRIASP